jgi:dihydrofolate reductase
MQPLRYSINVTLDGCVDHRAGVATPGVHRHHEQNLARADALIFGRVTYQLMEDGWRDIARSGVLPDGMPEWMMPFARVIDAAKKYVVSDTLPSIDWNGEVIRGADLERKVRELKSRTGNGLALGGVTLPLALAKLGLIDEYEFVVQPRLAGHGPWLFDGLVQHLDLMPVGETELDEGIVARRYVPRSPDGARLTQ